MPVLRRRGEAGAVTGEVACPTTSEATGEVACPTTSEATGEVACPTTSEATGEVACPTGSRAGEHTTGGELRDGLAT
jgi:hypothetical protein